MMKIHLQIILFNFLKQKFEIKPKFNVLHCNTCQTVNNERHVLCACALYVMEIPGQKYQVIVRATRRLIRGTTATVERFDTKATTFV
jgi:hypothetical protein